jgi:hypothetical protein
MPEELMKKWMTAVCSFLCLSLALVAQEKKTQVESVPEKQLYITGSIGAYFFGNVKVEDAKSGTGGIKVRDINAESGGAPAGFTLNVTGGYQITPSWAAEISAAFGLGGGQTKTGYEESQIFYANNGYGSGKTFTDNDKLFWAGGFVCIDIGASYDFFAAKKSQIPFFIIGKFGIGTFGYFRSDLKSTDKNSGIAGGLRYATIDGWHGGEEPGADYTETRLLKSAEGFYVKPGLDFGIKAGSKTQFLINTHVKIFPAAFAHDQTAVINDGTRQRTVGLTLPSWIVPNLTLGMKYYL